MEIVIGYQGQEHITASQLGRIIAGMAGTGTYVLGTQEQLAASLLTANSVKVSTGDIAIQGRVATVETPETLTIENGVTGQKRNDLIVARYAKEASSGKESCVLAVVKGTPVSYGEPTDPTLASGSILEGDSPVEVPLYRIPIDGLTPGSPVKLFEAVPSIDELRDSVSQTIVVESGEFGIAANAVPANGAITRDIVFDEPFPGIPCLSFNAGESYFTATATNVTESGFKIVFRNTSESIRPLAQTTATWIAIYIP